MEMVASFFFFFEPKRQSHRKTEQPDQVINQCDFEFYNAVMKWDYTVVALYHRALKVHGS